MCCTCTQNIKTGFSNKLSDKVQHFKIKFKLFVTRQGFRVRLLCSTSC